MNKGIIGIRREDKNIWEKRVPLVPDDIKKLLGQHSIQFVVQPALNHRAYSDEEYVRAGARIDEDLSGCDAIFGVKEIPSDKFIENRIHVFFAHVIKGQPYNMPMLRSMMQKRCTLIDYEKIEDAQNRRLIFFGRHAGLSGMVESLHALGKRLESEGTKNPFVQINQPVAYESLAHIKSHLREISVKIEKDGLPERLIPLVCGFTGYGNVSRGAQEIFDILPHIEVKPEELAKGVEHLPRDKNKLIKTIFYEKDMFEPIDPDKAFDLQDYFSHPQRYKSRFELYVPAMTIVVNCIFWTTACPRLITAKYLKELYSGVRAPRLKVIGDISCDIDGSMETTVRATSVSRPSYVYNPITETVADGVEGNGPVVMAIENLPCEIPKDASSDFSKVLAQFVPSIAMAQMNLSLAEVRLPDEIKRAVIVQSGELTEPYKYIRSFLDSQK
jgi:saccharopine dehydrogenase (NAD+, L-lysine forming)